ncbi:MAG TPA: VanW family protein [Candidatus Saccharimonadia bacterium]|nr:VanW family protein [Candidatus Saccharimonadia bacterium]
MTKNTDQSHDLPHDWSAPHLGWGWRLFGGALVLVALIAASFQLVYSSKIYPGVTADGVYVGGMSKPEAAAKLADHINDFNGTVLAINYGKTTLRLPINSLDVHYNTTKVIDAAYQFGRQGGWSERVRAEARALLGRPSSFAAYTYNDDALTPYLGQVMDDVVTAPVDAALSFNDSRAQVTPATSGRRVDLGRLVELIQDRLAGTDETAVTAPLYDLPAVVGTAALQRVASQADTYVSGPITLTYADVSQQIDQATITTWLAVGHTRAASFMVTHNVADLYPPPAAASLDLARSAVTQYVATLAARLDSSAQNAVLTMQNGQLTVTRPSRNGTALDQTGAVTAIMAALSKPADDRAIALDLKTTTADVNENNLDSLGIKEQLSEGQTFFPGSSSARLTNVSVGASKYNGVLLKPGEVFSFGKILGDVGPEQGYKPELVILGDHEEKQYGGGLCQVSSTAFRAALLAGLPIVERHNHSFAVSYYTAPYGVPGVDATIYYPILDFKFKNDTSSYILIQTIMQGSTLKFDFYGTKTKSGVIRGPQFVSGSNDATQPSHTVFWRDVLDAGGNVVKTDQFDTYYKSSKNYPVESNGFN